jgi:hypothetical protein
MDERWIPILEHATRRLTALGYEALDGFGGARHGSWECTWVSRHPGWFSIVVLAWPETADIGDAVYPVGAEVWYGYRAGDRYGRNLLASLTVPMHLTGGDEDVVVEAVMRAAVLALQSPTSHALGVA